MSSSKSLKIRLWSMFVPPETFSWRWSPDHRHQVVFTRHGQRRRWQQSSVRKSCWTENSLALATLPLSWVLGCSLLVNAAGRSAGFDLAASSESKLSTSQLLLLPRNHVIEHGDARHFDDGAGG